MRSGEKWFYENKLHIALRYFIEPAFPIKAEKIGMSDSFKGEILYFTRCEQRMQQADFAPWALDDFRLHGKRPDR